MAIVLSIIMTLYVSVSVSMRKVWLMTSTH